MKIPQYESQSGLSPTPMNPRTAAQTGEEISAVGEGLSALGDKFQEVQDKAQSTRAEVELYKKFNDINAQAASDPDIWNAPQKAATMMQKAVDETAQTITSGEARSNYQNKASVEMARRSVATNNMIRGKQIQEAKSATLNFVDAKTDEYWNSANDGEREAIRSQITDKVKDAVQTGIMHPEVANNYLKTHMDKLTDGQVVKDLDINAKQTLAELEKGKEGLYKELDPEKRDKLITRAKNMVVRQNKEGKEIHTIAQNKAEADIIGQYYKGGIKTDDVIRAQLSGRISEPFAKSVIKAIESPEAINHNTDAKEYMDLVDAMHSPNADPAKLRTRILDNVAAGKISNTVAMHLYTANMMVNDEGDKTSVAASLQNQQVNAKQKILDDAEKEKNKLKEQNSMWKSAVDFIKGWGKSKDTKATAETTQDFFRKVNESGTKPTEALSKAKEVVNQKNIEANPEISKNPKAGRLMMDSQGRKAIVYPDGSYEVQ